MNLGKHSSKKLRGLFPRRANSHARTSRRCVVAEEFQADKAKCLEWYESMLMDTMVCTRMLMHAAIFKPEVVVETGVANGVSSSFILKALAQNSRGRLYSVDLHYREGVSVPIGKKLGWIIPEELRNRWVLVLGESTKVLPKLLKKLGTADIFFHDSRHTYKTMMKEYSIVWAFLKTEGLLLSHDIKSNDAFLDFVDRIKAKPIVIGNIGVAHKLSSDIEPSFITRA